MSATDQTACLFVRSLTFLCLWSVVNGVSAADLAIGAFTAGGAAWASMCLFPCGRERPNLIAWIALLARIPIQALVAGAQVARRALDPALPLHPGWKPYETALPEGTAQDIFAAFAALLPGSVPVRRGTSGTFDIHCLDVDAPIASTLAGEEARLKTALGLERRDG